MGFMEVVAWLAGDASPAQPPSAFWPSNSSEWAAWVQAGGSILALIIAIGMPMWTIRKERINRELERAELAASMEARLVSAIIQLDDLVQKQAKEQYKTEPIEIPIEIAASEDRFYIWGTIGDTLATAIGVIRTFNRVLAKNEDSLEKAVENLDERHRVLGQLHAEIAKHINAVRLDIQSNPFLTKLQKLQR